MADDSSLGLASTETPAPPGSRVRRASAPTPSAAHITQPASPATLVRYVYYQCFGNSSALPSKRAFDPEDNTTGRVPARTIAPPRTAAVVKRYIAQEEGFDTSDVVAIYPSAESDQPIPDDARIPIFQDGGPGSCMWSPLAISLRETGSDGRSSYTALPTPQMLSPVLMPAPLQHFSTPPSPSVSLPHVSYPPDAQLHRLERAMTMSLSSLHPVEPFKDMSQAEDTQSHQPMHPWMMGEDGFAEPIESLTEACRVVSQYQPPGWLSGRVQIIGYGIFMGKLGKKHGNVTLGGTVLRDGMRVWVDGRTMKSLTLRTGDTFRTHRVIVKETREITYMWTGDIAIDPVQRQRPSVF